jgi:hypothetical protein
MRQLLQRYALRAWNMGCSEFGFGTDVDNLGLLAGTA